MIGVEIINWMKIKMPEIHDRRLTQKEVDRLMSPMELDLIAYFSQLQEDILTIIDRAERNNTTPSNLIDNIIGLLED